MIKKNNISSVLFSYSLIFSFTTHAMDKKPTALEQATKECCESINAACASAERATRTAENLTNKINDHIHTMEQRQKGIYTEPEKNQKK